MHGWLLATCVHGRAWHSHCKLHRSPRLPASLLLPFLTAPPTQLPPPSPPPTAGCWTPPIPCTLRPPRQRRLLRRWMARPPCRPQRAACHPPAPASQPPASFRRKQQRAWTVPGSEVEQRMHRAPPHACAHAVAAPLLCQAAVPPAPGGCSCACQSAPGLHSGPGQPGLPLGECSTLLHCVAMLHSQAAGRPTPTLPEPEYYFAGHRCGSWPPVACPAQH